MRCPALFLAASLLLSTGCASNPPDQPEVEASAPSSGPSQPGGAHTPDPVRTSGSGVQSSKGTRVLVDESDYGPMLYSAEGQAIYLFDREDSPRAQCYGDCAEEWPPVLTDGDPAAGHGVRPGLLDTTKRRGGSTQLTYAGHPLYFYANEGPHEVLCHDFFEFGGTWYVVQPSGEPAP